MRTFIELLTVSCLVIIPNLIRSFRWKQFFEVWSKRSAKEFSWQIFERLVFHIGLIFLFVYFTLNDSLGIKALGLKTDYFWFYVFGGIFLWGIIFITQSTFSRIFRFKKAKYSDSPVDNVLMPVLQASWQKVLYWLGDVVSVVFQEIFYRGYLILVWGEKTHLIMLYALFSICLYTISHLYQGKKLVYYHLIAAIFLSAITIITNSIIPAIAAHIFNNVITRLKKI